jgi:ribonuclease HI
MKKVIIYTDGGCAPNPGPGGWAAVLIAADNRAYKKELCGAEPDTTNNRMELLAAIMALRVLKYPCEVELHTDSKYLQNAFSRKWIENWQRNDWRTSDKKPVANQDLWQELIELANVHRIEWLWVKGHANHAHNERCDVLVAKARENLNKERNK